MPNRELYSDWLSIAQNKSGYDYSDEWNKCYRTMVNNLRMIREILNDGLMVDDRMVLERLGAFSAIKGAGDVAILVAVFFFSKYVNTPELAISVPAFSRGIDTDTIASMTGGLIGACYGDEWIPIEWRMVQDYSYIYSIAGKLCESDYSYVKNTDVQMYYDISQMEKMEEEEIKSKYSVLNISKYKMFFGQTIYIKSVIDKEKDIGKSNEDYLALLDRHRVEEIYNDKQLSRITLRKTMQIIMLISNGMNEDLIAIKAKVDTHIVRRIMELIKN